jgi:sterol desaturase/sphingolipid hydroxylase (fatty acid hydroxylase superfamily)
MNDLLTVTGTEDIRQVTLVASVAFFAVLLAIERIFPLRRSTRRFTWRLPTNAILTLCVLVTAGQIVGPVVMSTLEWAGQRSFGLLNVVRLSWPIHLFVTFVLMDLSFYYWHRLNHEVPLLWRFHNVHHIDPDLDVTTGFRFHPVEIGYSAGFRFLQILLIGMEPVAYLCYELVFICATEFHHSNVHLPLKFERVLNKVFVTPRMHGIHHSCVRGETNSNYSVVFRWWDWINRSLHLGVRQEDIEIGVPAYREEQDNRIRNALVMPFVRQRNYWRLPSGRRLHRDPDIWQRPLME